ncbi:MAG: hypothetical protein JWM25_1717 [Thermoleophilia bacterium]|nr:hypothetical protein [Thermoleophilia bacterium]MCZ4497132.1 hypothetical protein [Thermoleophilia bacterium]
MSVAPVPASRPTPLSKPAAAPALPAGPDYFPTAPTAWPTPATPATPASGSAAAGPTTGLNWFDKLQDLRTPTGPVGSAGVVPVGMTDLLTSLAGIATNAKPPRNWGQDRMHDAIPWPTPKVPDPPVDPIVQPTPKYV